MTLDASDAGLTIISTDELVIRRIKRGRGTQLVRQGAGPVSARHKVRIGALGIPPAWRHVRISDDPTSHIQAVGRDVAGRLQYIYHSDWEAVRSSVKAERLRSLLRALPKIRRHVRQHLTPQSPQCGLAAAVRLIDRLALRVGHEAYAGEESGRGAATLLKRHVHLTSDRVRVAFPGKGGKPIDKTLKDPQVVSVLTHLQKIPGKRLFKLPVSRGHRNMTATDVNDFLTEIAGEQVTAKDFRTLLASCYAISKLTRDIIPEKTSQRRRVISQVARSISEKLCNTPAIVKKSYIHSGILQQYESRTLVVAQNAQVRRGCSLAEAQLSEFLSKT